MSTPSSPRRKTFYYIPPEERKIPRRRPGTIRRMAGPNGDLEKVADTPLKELVIGRVKITSRYRKADEFEIMRGMIVALPGTMADAIKSIWCDTQANNAYCVTLRRWDRVTAEHVAACIRDYAMAHPPHGYNAIAVEGPQFNQDQQVFLDPDWGPGSPHYEELEAITADADEEEEEEEEEEE